MDNGSMIEIEDLTKRYPGRTAVSGVSFSVERGQIVGLLSAAEFLLALLPSRVAAFCVYLASITAGTAT